MDYAWRNEQVIVGTVRFANVSLGCRYCGSILSLVQPLRNEFPEFWEFLGIPRNFSLFQDMQMRKDEKPWNIGNTWEWVKTSVGIFGNS